MEQEEQKTETHEPEENRIRAGLCSWKERLSEMPRSRWYLITVIGVLILLMASRFETTGSYQNRQTKQETQTQEQAVSTGGGELNTEDYAAGMEKRLETILSAIDGVGKSKVILTLKASSEKIIDRDSSKKDSQLEETDANGGTRKNVDADYEEKTVLIGDGNGIPYVLQEISPEIEGILVVAQGGDSPVIAEQIIDALSALFGVSPHKIRVLKMSS